MSEQDGRMTASRAGDAAAAHRVIVVGGGIAGLAAAWELVGRGADVTVLEASGRVGGKLHVTEVGGVAGGLPVDAGAEAMIARRPEGVDLAREVGLGDALEAPATTSSALWTRGVLRPMPKGHLMGVPGDPDALAETSVISGPGLARLALEAELPPAAPLRGDTSVGGYVASRFGREVVDRLVEPLLGGVYAGSADRLSLQAAVPQLYALAQRGGSLLAGVAGHLRETRRRQEAAGGAPAPVFTGMRGGLGRLPVATAEAVRAAGGTVRTRTPATALRRLPDGRWAVAAETADGLRELTADGVVLAAPAPAAGALLAPLAAQPAAQLSAVEYADMVLITLAFRRADAEHAVRGSGFLVPPVDGRTIKAATFSGNKWAWVADADPGTVVLRTSVGRHGEERDVERDDADLVARARGDLRDAVGLTAEPIGTRVTRWHGGLPQYPVGHLDTVARVRRGIADRGLTGLRLCGAACAGVGIPACIGGAREEAARLAEELDAPARG